MSKAQPTKPPNSSAVTTSFDTNYQTGTSGGIITAAQYLYAAQNGATASTTTQSSWGQPSTTEPLTNFPFDSRINRIAANGLYSSGAFTSKVRVGAGYMTTVGLDSRTYSCIFQFNPTEIDMSYGFDSSVTALLNPSFLSSDAGTQSSQGLMLNNSISFTLLFDRTYEVWTGMNYNKSAQASQEQALINALNKSATSLSSNLIDPTRIAATDKANASALSSTKANQFGPYKFGVMWDVWAIERLAGIFGQYNGLPPSGPPAASITTVKFGPDAVGGTLSNTTSLGGGYALGFTGWMTAMEVQYTRFDASMVPTRCAVGLTFEQIYSLQAASTNPPLTVNASGQVVSS
jgi:hypothetical protein